MKKIIAFLLVSIFIISLPTSCKKDKGAPPVLPPASTMKIDFDNFTSGKKSIDLLSLKGTENSNFEFAAGCAGFFNLVLFTTLIVPVAAYEVAIDQTPVFIENATWQWSYTVTVLTVSYKARLTGQILSSTVEWKMYIAKEGGTSPFAEFMWFSGTSKLDGTGGQWVLNLSNTNPLPVLQIDWTGTGFEANEIKYTFVQTGNDYYGSYIEYGTTTEALDGYYNIHLWDGAADYIDVYIEWSTTGHNGRVKCFEEFGDNDWHAWDSNYVNI